VNALRALTRRLQGNRKLRAVFPRGIRMIRWVTGVYIVADDGREGRLEGGHHGLSPGEVIYIGEERWTVKRLEYAEP
jgi:hypothetical protein